MHLCGGNTIFSALSPAVKDISVTEACERAEASIVGGSMNEFKALLVSSGAKLRAVGKDADPKAIF
jgi:hypothetical protein